MPVAMAMLAARGLTSSSLVETLARDRDVLVVDVRPFLKFNKGHVRSAINIPCSPIMLRRLEKTGCIDDFVDPNVKERLRSAKTIVVYDEETTDINAPRVMGSPLTVVAAAVEQRCISLFFLIGKI